MLSEGNQTNSTVPILDMSILVWVFPCACTIAVLGIFANSYLIFTIHRRYSLRSTPTHVALLCLALIDAIHLVFLMCTAIYYIYAETKTRILCQVTIFGMYFATGGSSYHMVIFSVLRYIILVKPFFAMKYVTVKNILCCCLTCYFVFFCFAGLAFITADFGEIDTSDGKIIYTCITTKEGKYIEMTVFVVEFYIPIGLISGFHLAKWVHLKRRSVDTASAPTQKQQVSSAIVFTIIILYIIGYFPMSIYILIAFTLDIPVASNVHFLGFFLLALTPLNSALNPFVYFLFTKCVRKGQGGEVDINVRISPPRRSNTPSLPSE